MKTDPKHIETEVNKTLASLDGIQKANPKPYLYTRIMAKMENAERSSSSSLALKPAYQRIIVASLLILVAFNFFTATLYFSSTSSTTETASQEEMYFDQYYPTLTTIDNMEQYLTE